VTLESGAVSLEDLDPASWSALDRLARALHVREAKLQPTLDAIAVTAVQTITGAGYAGINLLERGHFRPQAVAGRPPVALDALQQQTGTGPCIDCSREQVIFRVDDMTAETRWPRYAELAVSLGVAAMLCVPLEAGGENLGSVSLYGLEPRCFTGHDDRLAGLFATHAALVLADARRTEQLRAALASRDVIGQAKGILMERERITADAAFRMLAASSQRVNRKLAVVARELAETGVLPA
jgi:GAF domain-containing protein